MGAAVFLFMRQLPSLGRKLSQAGRSDRGAPGASPAAGRPGEAVGVDPLFKPLEDLRPTGLMLRPDLLVRADPVGELVTLVPPATASNPTRTIDSLPRVPWEQVIHLQPAVATVVRGRCGRRRSRRGRGRPREGWARGRRRSRAGPRGRDRSQARNTLAGDAWVSPGTVCN